MIELILPADNEINVREDLKAEQLGKMVIHYVKTMDEVAAIALTQREAPSPEKAKRKHTPRKAARKPK